MDDQVYKLCKFSCKMNFLLLNILNYLNWACTPEKERSIVRNVERLINQPNTLIFREIEVN